MVKKTVNQDAAHRLPPLLRRRGGQPGRRPHLLRVPRRAAGPGRRRHGPPHRLACRLRRGPRLLGRAPRRGAGSARERSRTARSLRRPGGARARAGGRRDAGRAADRRPPGGPARGRAPGLPRGAGLLGRPRRQRRLLDDALGFSGGGSEWEARGEARGGLWVYDAPPEQRGDAGSRHRASHRLGIADGRARGLARARDRGRRTADAGDRPLLVPLDLLPRAQRSAVRGRDAGSRASAWTRIPSTWARS